MKMIRINERFAIKSDERQFVLLELIPVVDESAKSYGTIREATLGYYSSIETALSGISKMLFREKVMEKDMTINEAIAEFKIIAEQIKNYAAGF
jgi:hypothetical protein